MLGGLILDVDIRRTVVDATEIVVGVIFVLASKERVLGVGSRRQVWMSVSGFALLAGLLLAVAAWSTAKLIGYTDPDRSLVSIALSAALGFAVSIIAARLLIPRPRAKMQASQIQLTLDARTDGVLPTVVSGVVAASLIGLGGAIVGGVRFGPEYGRALFEYFGLAIGIPSGIAGGFVKWLSLPVANIPGDIEVGDAAEASPLRRTLRSDRVVAISTITAMPIAASVFALAFQRLFPGVFASISAHSPPLPNLASIQGVLFGLAFGVVVACFFTAWPTYFLSKTYLAARGRFPWRLSLFLLTLQVSGILKQEGALLQFRYREVQEYLAEEYTRSFPD